MSEANDLHVQWTLLPSPARLYQTVELTLDISHPLELELVPLEFGDTLGDFTVSSVVVSVPRIGEQRENHRITVSLQPHSAGLCQVGAIPVQCKSRVADDLFLVVVPPQEITILSTAAVTASPGQLHQATGPRPIPDYSGYYWGLGLLLVLFALVGLFQWNRRRLRALPLGKQPTPTQIAMKKLATLLDKRLHERDVKTFYFEITAIVRWFIEQVTQIRAPELTTEEFLKEIQRITDQNTQQNRPEQVPQTEGPKTNPNLITLATATGRFRIQQAALITSEVPATPREPDAEATAPPSDEWNTFFSEKNRAALAAFLEAADLVKFARFKPTREEVMLGFRRASELIESGRALEISPSEISPRPEGEKPRMRMFCENVRRLHPRFQAKSRPE